MWSKQNVSSGLKKLTALEKKAQTKKETKRETKRKIKEYNFSARHRDNTQSISLLKGKYRGPLPQA